MTGASTAHARSTPAARSALLAAYHACARSPRTSARLAADAARRRAALLGVAPLRFSSATAGRADARQGPGVFRAHPSRTRAAMPAFAGSDRDGAGRAPRATFAYTPAPGARGARWLAQSYAMFRRRGCIGLCCCSPIRRCCSSPSSCRVGALAAPVLKPVFWSASSPRWTQERGELPGIRSLFRGLSLESSGRWCRSASSTLVGITVAIMLFAVRRRRQLLGAISAGAGGRRPGRRCAGSRRRRGPQVQLGMFVGALAAIPSLFALWFAPALVVFQDASATERCSTSLRAACELAPILRYALMAFFFGACCRRCRDPHGTADPGADGLALAGADAAVRLLRRDAAHLGLRELSRRLSRRRAAADAVAQESGRLRVRNRRSSLAYSSASHLTPVSRKFTWTRASLPRPSALMMTPRRTSRGARSGRSASGGRRPAPPCGGRSRVTAPATRRGGVDVDAGAARGDSHFTARRRDLLEEARRDVVARLAVQHAALRVRQVQAPPRTRDRHVHEPPLLLDAAGLVARCSRAGTGLPRGR